VIEAQVIMSEDDLTDPFDDPDDFENDESDSDLTSLSGGTRQQPGRMYGEAWLMRLKSYNEEAWNQLFEDYASELNLGIIKSLRKLDLPLDRTDDIAQETWNTVIEQIHDFKWQGENKLYHWMRSISVNHVRTLRRKIHQEEPSFEEIETWFNGESGLDIFQYLYGLIEESPETIILRDERIQLFNLALQQLKPRDQEILTRRMYGETPAQIAPFYGIKPSSVSMVLVRVKTIIEEFIGREI
jgi:RNA polymerase sigma factor (sigma-70 family)